MSGVNFSDANPNVYAGRNIVTDGAKLDGLPTSAYSTVGISGTSETQRARINLIPGTGVTVANSDNSGTNSSDVTIGISAWTTFTPTVTLVGGAGNTVPQYTTNTGRYLRIGNLVFYQVYLNGDGGNEGAGTGQVNIALPVTASANWQGSNWMNGHVINGATNNTLQCNIAASATTIALITGIVTTALTGVDQNNTTRTINIAGWYEV